MFLVTVTVTGDRGWITCVFYQNLVYYQNRNIDYEGSYICTKLCLLGVNRQSNSSAYNVSKMSNRIFKKTL